MDAETLALLLIFEAGRLAWRCGYGLEVNPHVRRTKERAMWESGWLTMDRRMR